MAKLWSPPPRWRPVRKPKPRPSQTAAAALARYQAQVGNLIDRLQAQTALAQATLERVRAQSIWETARGLLALALGGDIAQPLSLADWESWAFAARRRRPICSELRQEARASTRACELTQSQIDGLRARLRRGAGRKQRQREH
jgi:outer membrane protein